MRPPISSGLRSWRGRGWTARRSPAFLDETAARDLFLDITGPFFERNGQLRENPGTIYALHALIILARDVAVMDVLGLLLRAGLISERQLDWKEGINGWLAHGRADDYFVSGDIYGQVRLTRWVRHPAIIGDLPDVLGDGQFLDNLTGQFAAEVLANSVLVPSEQYGRDMAQAHEEGNPSIAARAWQGARQSR